MAFDFFSQPQGPVIDTSLYGDAYSKGAATAANIPTKTTAIVQGIEKGISQGMSWLESMQKMRDTELDIAIKQHTLERIPQIDEAADIKLESDKLNLEKQKELSNLDIIAQREKLEKDAQYYSGQTEFYNIAKSGDAKTMFDYLRSGRALPFIGTNRAAVEGMWSTIAMSDYAKQNPWVADQVKLFMRRGAALDAFERTSQKRNAAYKFALEDLDQSGTMATVRNHFQAPPDAPVASFAGDLVIYQAGKIQVEKDKSGRLRWITGARGEPQETDGWTDDGTGAIDLFDKDGYRISANVRGKADAGSGKMSEAEMFYALVRGDAAIGRTARDERDDIDRSHYSRRNTAQTRLGTPARRPTAATDTSTPATPATPAAPAAPKQELVGPPVPTPKAQVGEPTLSDKADYSLQNKNEKYALAVDTLRGLASSQSTDTAKSLANLSYANKELISVVDAVAAEQAAFVATQDKASFSERQGIIGRAARKYFYPNLLTEIEIKKESLAKALAYNSYYNLSKTEKDTIYSPQGMKAYNERVIADIKNRYDYSRNMTLGDFAADASISAERAEQIDQEERLEIERSIARSLPDYYYKVKRELHQELVEQFVKAIRDQYGNSKSMTMGTSLTPQPTSNSRAVNSPLNQQLTGVLTTGKVE